MSQTTNTRINLPQDILEIYKNRAKAMKRSLKAQLEFTLEGVIQAEREQSLLSSDQTQPQSQPPSTQTVPIAPRPPRDPNKPVTSKFYQNPIVRSEK